MKNIDKTILFSLLVVSASFTFCDQHIAGQNREVLLHNNGLKYWDCYCRGYDSSICGNSLMITNLGTMREYYYENKKRRFRTYGDVILEDMKWKLKEDTLVFDQFKFVILKISKDSLEVQDLQQILGRERLFFLKSADQKSKPW
jgi:hypothetical protein